MEVGKLFFEEGLPGFLHLQFFRLVQEEQESPFYLLQSVEDEEIAFWVVDPFAFFPDYQYTLTEQAKTSLNVSAETNVMTLVIVTIRPGGEATVNLKAPIVINPDNRMAKQVIVAEDYQIRQPLLQLRSAASK